MVSTLWKSWSTGEKALFLVALTLVGLRFVGIGTVPFLIDEPYFQIWAEEFARGEKFRLTGMGGSSLPVPYGAGATWLFAIPHFFTHHPLAFVLFHTLVYSTGFFFLYLALRTGFGNRGALWPFALAASSPLLFFFSRHAWDTTFFMPITGAVLYLLARLTMEDHPRARRRWLLLGIAALLALAINIQLAVGPFCVAAGLWLLVLWARQGWDRRFFVDLLIFGAVLAALILPYLIASFHVIQTNPPVVNKPGNPRWGSARHLWWNLLYSLGWIGAWKGKHFFEPVAPQFFSFVGPVLTPLFQLDLFGWLVKVGVLMGLFAPIAHLRTGWRNLECHLRQFGPLALFVVLFVFQYLNIPMQPHYFQSFWWLPFLGLAAFLARFPSGERIWVRVPLTGALATNALFLAASLTFLLQNGGTRGLHHGTGILHVREVVGQICEEAKRRGLTSLNIEKNTVFTPDKPIEYFASHDPNCAGTTIRFMGPDAPETHVRILYPVTSASDAHLELHWR